MYVYTQLFIRYKFHDSLRKEKETKIDHHLKEVIRELDIEGMKQRKKIIKKRVTDR